MTWTLPPFNDLVNEKADRKKKIFQSNISYNPLYNQVYDIEPKIVDVSGEKQREMKVSIFEMPLSVILKNIANTLLLILVDLTNVDNYSSTKNFLKIFMIENRMIYFGMFIAIVAIYIMFFFH